MPMTNISSCFNCCFSSNRIERRQKAINGLQRSRPTDKFRGPPSCYRKVPVGYSGLPTISPVIERRNTGFLGSSENTRTVFWKCPLWPAVPKVTLTRALSPGAITPELRRAAVQPQPLFKRKMWSESLPTLCKTKVCTKTVSSGTFPKAWVLSVTKI